MADLPMADRDRMLEWADLVTHTPGRQAEGLTKLCDYLEEKIERRRDNPGDDLLSILAKAEFDGVHPSRDIVHVAVNVVMGGLDTVVAGLSFIIGYLARHPDHYRRIVEDRGQIKRYLEELMRLHGVACTERHVKSDFEFRGVRLKERDRFVMVPALYGIDPDEVENPLAANFDRGQTHHMLFGTGIHHCVGSHLARLEMRVFLEEWTHAIPAFGLEPGTGIDCIGGFVFQPKAVHLSWDVAATRPVTTDDQRAA
jgi:cytochrome P450